MYEDELWYVVDAQGQRSFPDLDVGVKRLSGELDAVGFEVLYIGQAYGKDGSRNALDRLLKHETLQKISLKGVPDGYRLNLLLLEVQPATTMFTVFNPVAENIDQGSQRISSGWTSCSTRVKPSASRCMRPP